MAEIVMNPNKKPEDEQELIFDKVEPIELAYQRISVIAKIKQERTIDGKTQEVDGTKEILNECSGKFQPYTFTAILGPSGCGKTTMLNLISGRQLSDNLELRGVLRVNGVQTTSIVQYKNYIGYVMQEDYMLPTFTPYQSFKFVTDLRLSNQTEQEREKVVEAIIANLGLQKCRDTNIGDTRIRGISGGERKRTSIGLQLLINPSIIFLDEPTTGLDSTTSLNLIRFLNRLAKQGRTVISTIHQPNSQIFMEFNHIVLMVDGHIIYDGQASHSMKYFESINLPVPQHTNPTDHYMKIMNKEGLMLTYLEKKQEFTEQGIKEEFKQRVDHLVKNYQKMKSAVQNRPGTTNALNRLSESLDASWCLQFGTVFKRSWVNQFRQPLDVILKIFQSIFFGLICILLFYEQGTKQNEIIQNTRGVIFFLVMNVGFAYVFSSVNIFNFERPVFIRQRLSNTYNTSAYFFGRLAAVQPIQIFTVFLLLVVCYFAVNLDNSAGTFFLSLLSLQLCGYMSSAFGLMLSAVFSDAAIVMALVPILIIPFLLTGGFFVPLERVFWIFYPFEYLSMFRYGYQAMIYSQYEGKPITINGTTIDVMAKYYHFQIPFWLDLALMAIIGTVFRFITLFIMYKISNPKVVVLQPPLENGELVANNQSNTVIVQPNRS